MRLGSLGNRTAAGLLLAGLLSVAWLNLCHGQTPGEESLYPDSPQAASDLAQALRQAAQEKKRIILDFGGNWCPDCRVLDIYFHDPSNVNLLRKNFIVVHINVGHLDENRGLAARYRIPLKRGVPALAVLDSRGRLLYSQRSGEFEAMSRVDPSSVTEFLLKWKP